MASVSVVLTTYNAANIISSTLDNILSQTLEDIEIIIVDDHSTDETVEIIRAQCQSDARVKLLVNDQNYNAGYSRNRGLREATGQYIIFLDDDDIYMPKMLETALAKAQQTQACVTVLNSQLYDDNKDEHYSAGSAISWHLLPKKEVFSGQEINDNTFNAFTWWAWDKLFLREYLLGLHLEYQEIKSSNDLFFVCAAVLSSPSITLCEEILISHRENRQGSLSNKRENHPLCAIQAVEKLYHWLQLSEEYSARYHRDFVNYCTTFFSWSLSTLKEFAPFALQYNYVQQFVKSLSDVDEALFFDPFFYGVWQELTTFTPEQFLMAVKNRLHNDVLHGHLALEESKNSLESVQHSLEVSQQENNQLQQQQTDVEQQLADSRNELQTLQEKLQQLTTENQHLSEMKQQLEQQVEDIKQSTSWKLTAPLRAIASNKD